MESKKTFFIMIVIVAVLALALAALAGYLLVVQGGSGADKTKTEATAEGEGEQTIKVPKEEELVKIPLFSEAKYFNLKSTNPDKTSIIQANVTLKCYKTLKRDKKAVVSDLVTARSEEIQELVVRFFMTMTADDVKDPAVLDKAKQELTNQINTLMNEGEEKPEDIVYRVIFSEWLFQ